MPSDAQKRSARKWDVSNMKVLSCKLRREVAEEFAAVAKANGTTPNELLRGFVMDYLAAHKPDSK